MSNNQYMDINQFLDTYFNAITDNKKHRVFVNFVQGLLNNNSPEYQQRWLFDMQDSLSANDKALFNQYIAAMQDNSPAAKDFMNMVQVFTFFNSSAAQDTRQDRETKAKVIIDAVQNGAIKNPLYSYKLLKQIPEYALSKETDKARWLALTKNPYATAYDAANYAKYTKSPEEIFKLIDDFKIKTENALEPELAKDIKNADNIKEILDNNYGGLGNMFGVLHDLTIGNAEQFNKMKTLAHTIDEEFNLHNILELKSGNYIKQYKESAEMQLAQIKPEMEKAKQQLVNAQDSEHQLNLALESAQLEIQKLQEQLKQKDKEIYNTETKYNILKGQINLYLRDANERANGNMFNKGKDLAEMLKKLQQEINK